MGRHYRREGRSGLAVVAADVVTADVAAVLFLLVFRTKNTQKATKMIVNKKNVIGCYFRFDCLLLPSAAPMGNG